MRIAHISDIHWLDLTGVKARDFLNKRWIGGVNLFLGRAKKHQHAVTEAALDAIRDLKCDHLVVTGDLTNLAFESEFLAIKTLLHRYFDDQHMLIVPGNHDYYTRESGITQRFKHIMYETYPGDEAFHGNDTWPIVQIRGDVAMIGLCSAQPRSWFVAAGRLGKTQLTALENLLKTPELDSKFKLLAFHHHIFPVTNMPGESFKNLEDRKELLELCHKYHVDLILHGHNHDFTQLRSQNTVISEAGSCSAAFANKPNHRGKFNVYDVEDGQLKTISTYLYQAETGYALWKTVSSTEIPNAPGLR